MMTTDNRGGFTLIEVLMAISIFAIGLLAVAGMQVRAIRGNATGNTMTQATNLARAQLDSLINGDITTADYTVGTHADPNNPVTATGAAGGIFTRTWKIAANTAFSVQATVNVTWTLNGKNHLVSLTTVTRGGGI